MVTLKASSPVTPIFSRLKSLVLGRVFVFMSLATNRAVQSDLL